MYPNLSRLSARSLPNQPLLNAVLSRSYAVNSRPTSLPGKIKAAAANSLKNKQNNSKQNVNSKPTVQPAKMVANDLGGPPSHPERSVFEGMKVELRSLKEDVFNENARRFVSQANETANKVSNKAGSVAGAGNVMNAVKSASSKAAATVQNFEAKAKSSLNDVIDAAEDKLGSFREPRAKQPVNPKIDALAEEDINDLIDELEDKVRGMDHVKEAIADPKTRGAFGVDAKNPRV